MRLLATPQPSADLELCKREGRKAFREHGVTGDRRNPHEKRGGSYLQWQAFMEGFNDERNAAAKRAQDEEVAYRKLTIREAPIDREWAERLYAGAA